MNGIEHIRAALTTNRLVSMNEAMEADNTETTRQSEGIRSISSEPMGYSITVDLRRYANDSVRESEYTRNGVTEPLS